MYPKYRRPEYGILEGGHNFTPDRLHNEYLNTMATRGVVGFLIYYVGWMGGWFFVILRGLYRRPDNPYRFVIAGLMAGCSVYLGQVFFNFGVVATLFLFYALLGLSVALTEEREFE
jgi:O-antigen ligase